MKSNLGKPISFFVVMIDFISFGFDWFYRSFALHVVNALCDAIYPDPRVGFRASPMNCIADNSLHIFVVIDWVGFVSWSEVKYLSIASLVTKSRPEYFSSFEPTYKDGLIR